MYITATRSPPCEAWGHVLKEKWVMVKWIEGSACQGKYVTTYVLKNQGIQPFRVNQRSHVTTSLPEIVFTSGIRFKDSWAGITTSIRKFS